MNGNTFLSLSELATEFEIAVVAMNHTATRVDRKDTTGSGTKVGGFANNGTVVVGDATIVVTIYNTTNLWMPWRVSKNTITVGIACSMY